MLIIEQPNLWSCMPAAFATVTGVPISTLLELIGHDGSEVVFPDLSDPQNRRGFVGQEITRSLLHLGFMFATFECIVPGYLDDEHFYQLEETDFVHEIMRDSIGVLGCIVKSTGRIHAVAWDGHQCYDPTGFIRPLDYYEVQVYYRLGRA